MTAVLPVRIPLIQAPMAGVSTPELAAAVSNAGALGSIAIGAATVDIARAMIGETWALTDKPFNVNVFCHRTPCIDTEREAHWRDHLVPLFARFDADPPSSWRQSTKASMMMRRCRRCCANCARRW